MTVGWNEEVVLSVLRSIVVKYPLPGVMESDAAGRIDIVMICDNSLVAPSVHLVNSIVSNTTDPKRLRIHIICEDIAVMRASLCSLCWLDARFISTRAEAKSNHIVVLCTPDKALLKDASAEGVFQPHNRTVKIGSVASKTKNPVSAFNFIRFWLPDLLPEYVDKVIYLDCDMVVHDNIEKLWNKALGNHDAVAVIRRPIEKSGSGNAMQPQTTKYWVQSPTLRAQLSSQYVWNNGMFVTSLNKWRANGWTENMRALACDNLDGKNYIGGTQVPFNLVMKNVRFIGARWNGAMQAEPLCNRLLNSTSTSTIAIFHWAGPAKPWSFSDPSLFQRCSEYWHMYGDHDKFVSLVKGGAAQCPPSCRTHYMGYMNKMITSGKEKRLQLIERLAKQS